VVTIKLEADAQGRFGFNVKGGVEMQSPVLVSRVAPNTPASRATPPIREGDQVLLINERDVSGLMHEEIVNLIRSSHGNLLLTIKLNRECKTFSFSDLKKNHSVCGIYDWSCKSEEKRTFQMCLKVKCHFTQLNVISDLL
jgi:PDZ domain